MLFGNGVVGWGSSGLLGVLVFSVCVGGDRCLMCQWADYSVLRSMGYRNRGRR